MSFRTIKVDFTDGFVVAVEQGNAWQFITWYPDWETCRSHANMLQNGGSFTAEYWNNLPVLDKADNDSYFWSKKLEQHVHLKNEQIKELQSQNSELQKQMEYYREAFNKVCKGMKPHEIINLLKG